MSDEPRQEGLGQSDPVANAAHGAAGEEDANELSLAAELGLADLDPSAPPPVKPAQEAVQPIASEPQAPARATPPTPRPPASDMAAVPFAKVYTGGGAPAPAPMPAQPATPNVPSSFESAYVPPNLPHPLPVAAVYTGLGAPAAGYVPPAYPPAPSAYPQSYGQVPPGTMPGYALLERPGLVTALGAMCFIVGSLGLLANFFTGCSSAGMMEQTRRGALVVKAGGGSTGGVTTYTATATTEASQGLDDSDRYMILQAMQRKASSAIAPARMRQAEGLLARRGREIFKTSSPADGGGGLSVVAAGNDLVRAGREYAGAGNKGPDFFRFVEGTACKMAGQMRVWDDHAVYEPAEGGEIIRVTVKENEMLNGAPVAGAAPPRDPASPPPPVPLVSGGFAGLDESELSAVIAQAQRFGGNRINAAQLQAIRDELGAPTAARWVTPTTTVTGFTTQVKSTVANGDGSIVLVFGTARMAMRADGSMDWASSTPMQVTAPAAASGPVGFGVGTGPVFIANTTALKIAMVEAIASAILAGLLIWFGAMLFQKSRWIKRALFSWAVAKIIIGAAGLSALVIVRKSLDMVDPGTNGLGYYMQGSLQGGSTTAIVLTALGLLFPLGVLIALKTRDVSGYLGRAGGAAK